LDLVLDVNYFSFPHPIPNPNPTHLPKHESPSPNHEFSQRIWYVEYYSVHKYMAWSHKFSLTPVVLFEISQAVLPLLMFPDKFLMSDVLTTNLMLTELFLMLPTVSLV